MNSGTMNLLDMLSERVLVLSNEGNWDEAYKAADAAVEQARRSLDSEDESSVFSLVASLEIKGDLLRQMGHLEDARVAYLEALEVLGSRRSHQEMLARLNGSIGVLYDLVGNGEEATQFYERAVTLYERMENPDKLEIADICNNLGFIYQSLEDFDKAEKTLLKALEICHHEVGDKNEKTATVLNNLGAMYLKTNLDQQAYEMSRMALESRIAVLGEHHADTAQSYANLALSQAKIGDDEAADESFRKGVLIYEGHMKEDSQEYVVVVENYVEYLRALDRDREANAVLKKAQKKLSKVSQHH